MIGYNINGYYGNKGIPEEYFLNPTISSELGIRMRSQIRSQVAPSRVRTLIWLAEADPVETPWLHIPLTDAEVEHIQAYAWAWWPTLVELSLGPLWEALWMTTEYGVTVPDHPEHSPQELFTMYQSSLWRLLFTSRGLPKTCRFDVYNEFDINLGPKAQETMALWYPWARDALKESEHDSMVSLILPSDGSPDRAIATAQWILALGYGAPTLWELHCNGWSNAMLESQLPVTVAQFRKALGWPRVTLGECDVDLDAAGWRGLVDCDAEEVLLWK